MLGYVIMDNASNKYSKWVMTILEGGEFDSLPTAENLGRSLEEISDKFVFQLEVCPSTGRKHYQCCFTTRIRKRHRTVLFELSASLQVEVEQITIDRMSGSWEQAVEYCSKEESRVGQRTYLSPALRLEEERKYQANDLKIFTDGKFYPWQEALNNIIFESNSYDIKASSSRTVYWIEDIAGNSGKSIFTKFLCYTNPYITKLAFGSGSQMRTAIVEEGAMKCYIIDIPRQLCNDDFQNNIYSVAEELKNGFVKTSMYGNPRTLFMEPPIVIFFSNFECPTEKLSIDRWKLFSIIKSELVELVDERAM